MSKSFIAQITAYINIIQANDRI